MRFEYEYQDEEGQSWRAHGNEVTCKLCPAKFHAVQACFVKLISGAAV